MNGDFSAKLDQILGNPAMLSQIKALADTMTTANTKTQPPPEEAPAPPFHEKKEENREVLPSPPVLFTPSPNLEKNLKHTRDLLIALKPFLDEKRCVKIDKMLSMMRLAEMAGQFGSLF